MEPRISIITLGVGDLDRARTFYEALGLERSGDHADIVFFKTSGTVLALYSRERVAEDVDPALVGTEQGFSGVTLAHNARTREEVDEILATAVAAGATLTKPAELAFWGGYSGYFRDPDGHLWEVAHADFWQFHADGSLVLE